MVLPDSTPDQLPTLQAFAPPADVNAEQVGKAFVARLADAVAAARADKGCAMQELFIAHGYWRDVLAFTRELHTFKTENIAQVAADVLPSSGAADFTLLSDPAPALQTPFPDLALVRIHYTFATTLGPGYGTASLVYDSGAGSWKAWTLATELDGVKGHTQALGDDRVYGRHNDTMPYEQRREHDAEMADREPDLVVVGAGHNGLAVAALAKSWGLEPLVIDREKRIGDNWRLRYSSLSLHDPVMTNHLPLMPFPRSWPLYTPAGKLANWLESYADIMEINVWLESTTDPARTVFDEAAGKWKVTVLRTLPDGTVTERVITTSHVVLATGLGGGVPRLPPLPGRDDWAGKVVHSSGHPGAKGLEGKRVLIVGACTSAFDIAADLANRNVDTTMLQRSPTFIMSLKNGIHVLTGGVFNNSTPIDVADHIAAGTPRGVLKLFHQRLTAWLKQQDAELLAGLEANGFKTYSGPDGAGFAFLAMERAGGYYFDTGTCGMIAAGKIKIRSGEIASLDADSMVTLKDGESGQYDLIICATGYEGGYKDSVLGALGLTHAENLTQVFGCDPEGEMNGIARACGIPNMYFNVGNLGSSRQYGKAIVFQILAQKAGLWKEPYYRPGSKVQAPKTGGFFPGPPTVANGNGTNGVKTNGAH